MNHKNSAGAHLFNKEEITDAPAGRHYKERKKECRPSRIAGAPIVISLFKGAPGLCLLSF